LTYFIYFPVEIAELSHAFRGIGQEKKSSSDVDLTGVERRLVECRVDPQRTKENQMPTETKDEAQIRELIGEWVKAMHDKNVDKLMSLYTPDILVFDLAPPLQHEGSATYRQNWEAWLPTFEGPVDVEVTELKVTVNGDVGFSHSLNRLRGTKKNGEKPDLWVRVTVGFRKVEDRWLACHEHVSVPFYMDGSFRAAVDLKP
jgi:uncharacterized protein (TIGR02246 family)